MQKEFRCITRAVNTPFKFNLALDFGSEPGNWLVIVVGKTALGIGYLPKLKYLKNPAKVKHPSLLQIAGGAEA
jgi:hypothetical protein